MKHQDENSSAKKENSKVQTDKHLKDNEVREGQSDNSIYDEENNKSAYPYKHAEDKQHKTQEEYLDRNNDSTDKS